MQRHARHLLAIATALAVTAGVGGTTITARADTLPGLTVAVGKPTDQSYPAIAGQGYPYGRELKYTPEACGSDLAANDPTDGTASSVCNTIPLKLNVANVKAHDYLLSATLIWDNGARVPANVPNFGGAYQNAMRMLLWRVPYNKLEDGTDDVTPLASTAGIGTPAPTGMAFVDPDVTTYALTVVNYTGSSNYSIHLELQDLGDRPVDASVDTSFKDLSDLSGITVTPSAIVSGAVAGGPTGGTPGVAVSPSGQTTILGPVSGSQLDAIGDAGLPVGINDVTNILAGARPKAPPIPKAVSTALLLFWLVIAPILLIGLFGGWLRRRRKGALAI